MSDTLDDRVLELCQRDSRYVRNAYLFVLEALDFTLNEVETRRDRHVGGRELLEGIRDLAKARFGLLAKEVFNQWGIRSTEDFGQVVFNLVSEGLLQRRPQDSIHDFADGYDFEREFERDYKAPVPWAELHPGHLASPQWPDSDGEPLQDA